MWGNVCIRTHKHTLYRYTHTQTHTPQMWYSDVSPGVGIKHLEGSNNLDGLNLGIYIFIYVYKVHMCMYMLGGGMRSWTNCFFFNIFFFPKKKSKRCERKPPIISNLNKIWAQRERKWDKKIKQRQREKEGVSKTERPLKDAKRQKGILKEEDGKRERDIQREKKVYSLTDRFRFYSPRPESNQNVCTEIKPIGVSALITRPRSFHVWSDIGTFMAEWLKLWTPMGLIPVQAFWFKSSRGGCNLNLSQTDTRREREREREV